MIAKINNRFKSNRGDANSVSQILWIAIAAAVISVVGLAIFNATKYSGISSAARLENLDCFLKEGMACTYEKTNLWQVIDGEWVEVPDSDFACPYEKIGDKYVLTEEWDRKGWKKVGCVGKVINKKDDNVVKKPE